MIIFLYLLTKNNINEFKRRNYSLKHGVAELLCISQEYLVIVLHSQSIKSIFCLISFEKYCS